MDALKELAPARAARGAHAVLDAARASAATCARGCAASAPGIACGARRSSSRASASSWAAAKTTGATRAESSSSASSSSAARARAMSRGRTPDRGPRCSSSASVRRVKEANEMREEKPQRPRKSSLRRRRSTRSARRNGTPRSRSAGRPEEAMRQNPKLAPPDKRRAGRHPHPARGRVLRVGGVAAGAARRGRGGGPGPKTTAPPRVFPDLRRIHYTHPTKAAHAMGEPGKEGGFLADALAPPGGFTLENAIRASGEHLDGAFAHAMLQKCSCADGAGGSRSAACSQRRPVLRHCALGGGGSARRARRSPRKGVEIRVRSRAAGSRPRPSRLSHAPRPAVRELPPGRHEACEKVARNGPSPTGRAVRPPGGRYARNGPGPFQVLAAALQARGGRSERRRRAPRHLERQLPAGRVRGAPEARASRLVVRRFQGGRRRRARRRRSATRCCGTVGRS